MDKKLQSLMVEITFACGVFLLIFPDYIEPLGIFHPITIIFLTVFVAELVRIIYLLRKLKYPGITKVEAIETLYNSGRVREDPHFYTRRDAILVYILIILIFFSFIKEIYLR